VIAHLKYLKYIVRHKAFVLVAGIKLRVPIVQLITHDWSKFLPSEWFPYVAHFYGDYPEFDPTDPLKWINRGYTGPTTLEVKQWFDRAWNYHQKRQPHRWQFWLLTSDQPSKDWVITSQDGGMSYFGLANYKHTDRNFLTMDATGTQGEEDAEYLQSLLNRMPIPLPMPEHYAREMVADWLGAGRAITGKWEAKEWYQKNKNAIILHPTTRAFVENLLEEISFD
jgi:hypothetical protein